MKNVDELETERLRGRRLRPDDYDRVLAEELALIPWGEIDPNTMSQMAAWPAASYRWRATLPASDARGV